MQPTTYTGDPEFIDECKEAYVQAQDQPQLILLNNLSAHTPADELFMRFFSILKGLSTSTFATQAKYALLRLERQVIDQAVILTAQAELPKETKPKNALKPVEIYSRFSDILRFIGTTSKVYGLDAIQVLRDVYLSQTQTDSELDNRFWVDSMTGQTDPEFAITDVDIPEVHVLSPEGGEQAAVTAMAATEENSARFKKPIEISKWDKWCVQRSGELQAELGWTNEMRWQWVEAQGASSGSGEIEDEEDPEDDRGYVPPTLVKDLVDVGEKAPLNKGCFAPISFAFYDFNKARKTLFAEMAIKSEMNKAAYDVISKLDKALAAPLKRFDKVNTPYQLSELLKILAIAMFQKDSPVSLPDARQKVLEYIASSKLLHGEEYNLTEGDKVTGNTWKPYFQKHIRQTEAFAKMVNAIQSTADHFGAKEAVAVYLKVAGDYGLLAGANKAHAPAQIKKLIADIVAVKKKNATIATFLASFKDVNVPEEAFHLIEKYHVALFSKEKPKARKPVLAKAEMQLLEYIFSFYQAEGEEYDASEVYNDISQIKLNPHLTIDGITDFEEFLAEYETDISDMLNDGSLGVFPTSERVVDEFVAQTKEMIAHRYPTHDHNALNTASWNLAYQNAITSGASFPDAEAKAWEAWRYAMSFFAAKEYDRVMKVERNRTKAMAAFWRFAPPSVPRPQDKIVSVNKNGLVFKKRNVTWGIAKLKLSKDELEIDNELASRLFGILKEKGWGNGFEKQLALKFSIK